MGEQSSREKALLAEVMRTHEALLTTLAASKHPWVAHVYRNAKAYYEQLKAVIDEALQA